MMQMKQPSDSKVSVSSQVGSPDWKADFLASLVVFLVALPLCIGIAVAVGVNPARALITGIIGGIVVGMFAGSPLQVSGPAAGLFVILAELLANAQERYVASVSDGGQELNEEALAYALSVMGASVFIAGLGQLFAGWLGIGQWFRAVSPAVIKGMLAGIGVLILSSQFHVMLDHTAMWHGEKAHGGVEYLATIPQALGKCFPLDNDQSHHLAATTGIITIAIILLWPRFAPKRLRILPAPLVGVIVATAFAVVMKLDIVLLEIPENMFSETTFPSTLWTSLLVDPLVLSSAVVICMVASAETLLCATAVDQMHDGPRTKYDQELMAQGVGNTLCGLVGALPMTGVIVRSSANVSAGAKSRWSTVLHGTWLLMFVVLLPWLLSYIPRAALGGLLVYTGCKLVNIKELRNLWSVGKSEAFVFLATLGAIVATDLLIGVFVGIAISAIKLLHRFAYLDVNLHVADDEGDATLVLQGAATFLRLPLLAKNLERIPRNANVNIDLHSLLHIDHACLELIRDWTAQHERGGGKVSLDWKGVDLRFHKPVHYRVKQ